jgi:hypothetical protein
MTRRVAVLIASSRFPDEPKLSELAAPERDVDGLAGILAKEQGGAYDDVIALKNQPCSKVRIQLNRVLRQAGKEDQVLIYFSGHGKLDPTGRLCLAMTDTVLDVLEASSLRISEIKDFIDGGKCRQVMLFLDCCYSGAVGRSFTRGDVDDHLQLAADKDSGICIMSASNAVQTALETPDAGLGVFTRHVIEGVKSGAADVDGDGRITFDELYDYVRRKVVAEGHQRPQKWAFQAEGELLVARTGKDLWEDERKKARQKVLALAGTGDLPDAVVGAAISLLNVPRREQSEKQRAQAALLANLAAERTRVGEFILEWTRLDEQSEPIETPPVSAAALPAAPAPAPLAPPPAADAASRIRPGRWVLETVTAPFVKTVSYYNLKPSGEFTGSTTLWGMSVDIHGTWTFDAAAGGLVLDKVTEILGQKRPERTRIKITGEQFGSLTGTDESLRPCKLTRQGDLPPGMY